MEWQAEDQMRCSSCGFPRDESMADKPEVDYRHDWKVCRACETAEIAQRDAQEESREGRLSSGRRLILEPFRLNGEVHSG